MARLTQAVTAEVSLLEAVGDWPRLLAVPPSAADLDLLRRQEHTGRTPGDGRFIAGIEQMLGRHRRPGRPGRRRKQPEEGLDA